MKHAALAILLSAAVAWGAASTARAAETKAKAKPLTTCQLCGMDAAKSETEFILYRKTAPQMHACCINCVRRMLKKLDDVERVTALDYRTRKHVPAEGAFYVFGSKRMPRGSMTPFVFSFGDRADADAFKERNNGEVLSFSEVIARLEAGQKGKPRAGSAGPDAKE
jgi:nitrous oxide reductase accessory protein NosL